MKMPPLRSITPPLYTAPSIYTVLVSLDVGQVVPANIYIADHRDGTIPTWTIAEREEYDILVILTLIDPTTAHSELATSITRHVALDVFSTPERILCTPSYVYFPGCKHARNQLGDIRQEARRIAERLDGVAQGTYEPSPGFGRYKAKRNVKQPISR